ncbi:MAG: hypothetical protein SH850_11485 [Planctomycetaceae bacterium]|nr:hypothetical protein [Planctomycetaceae bacterium]
MDNSADFDLNELSTEELAALKSDLSDQLRCYFRHIVGLAGAYEHIQQGGIRKPQKPFYYSAAVIEVCNNWYLLTAGHNVRGMEAAATRQDMKLVACGLDDTYAPLSQHKGPIPVFDFQGAHRFYQDTEGLDFGLIHIRPHYRDLLKANGIQPLTEHYWNPNEVDACDKFLMVGFPERSIYSGVTFSPEYYRAEVKGAPSVILIDRLLDTPTDLPSTRYPRFIGQIRAEHDVGSIVGMSGGPIFCFKGHDFEPYYVAATQSTWIEQRKITFGCPLPVIIETARKFLTQCAMGCATSTS